MAIKPAAVGRRRSPVRATRRARALLLARVALPARALRLAGALLVAGALLLGAMTAAAQAGAGATIEIGSRTVSVPASEISAQSDVSATYTLRTAPGRSQSITLHGISIHLLLSLAGVDPGTVSSVTVGSAGPLSPVDIADPPIFAQGPALIAVSGSTTRYFRPVRGPDDVNAGDYITTPAGLPIDVVVGGGGPASTGSAPLRVTATAVPTEAAVGQRVLFSALVENAPPGALNYSWSFGDGASAFGIGPSHAYAADGDYPAYVTVSGGGGNVQGVAAKVIIHVGSPKRRSSGSGLGNSNAAGSGAGGTGSGKGGVGPNGGNGSGGKGVTQPKPAPKRSVAQPVQPAKPVGAAAKTATAPPAAPDGSAQISGVLLADAGSPFDLRLSPPPPAGGAGAAHKSAGGATQLGAVLGGLALALAIATLGGLHELRRLSSRPG